RSCEIFVRAATERRLAADVGTPWFREEDHMRKLLLAAAAAGVLAAPALADEVVVRPPAADVTIGESHPVVRDRTEEKTVIKKDEPGGQTTVIKKEDSDGNRSKTVIHHDD